MDGMTRRTMIKGAGAALAAAALGSSAARGFSGQATQSAVGAAPALHLKFAVKSAMVQGGESWTEKFEMLQRLGYDGIDVDNTNRVPVEEFARAREATGFRVHGVVDPHHWNQRLSSPDADVRRQGREALEQSIRDAKTLGGSTVLLVPGRVADAATENHDHVWERSIIEIRKVLPLAADLGIYILIENVWNGFCYDPDGPNDQSPDRLIAYIDEINSPWVGVYFDIGNIERYGRPEVWIRRLGRRIAKLDAKGWSAEDGFGKIGDGDVDWAAVRAALADIGFTGWATAEVGGGGEERMAEIKQRMDRVLGG